MKILKSLFKSTAYSLSSSVLSHLTILILARSYSVEIFSYYLYIITWALLIQQVLDFASEQCLVHFSVSNSRPIESAWKSLVILKVLSVVTTIIIFFILNYQFNIVVPSSSLLLLFPLFYLGPVYEMYRSVAQFTRLLFLERLIVFVTAVVVVIFRFDVNLLIYGMMTISLASLWIQIRNFKIPCSKVRHFKKDIKQYVINYASIYGVLFSQLAYGNISRLIAENKFGLLLFGSMSLGFQFISAISIIQVPIDRHIRPEIFDAINGQDFEKIKKIVRLFMYNYLLWILLGCIVLSIFGQSIVTLIFGEKWSSSGKILSLASPLILLIACMRFIDIMALALKAGVANLIVNLSSATLLLMALWLIPIHSISVYIILIILFQSMHVLLMITYLLIKAKNIIGLRPSI